MKFRKKVYVLITIDTECDKNFKWEIPRPMAFKNIELQEALLFPVFKKHGIIPTYLLSPEVIKDVSSVTVFKRLKHIELGTHLHEEFISPDENPLANRTKNVQANLEQEIEWMKLKNLTTLFNETFGYWPKSFRSGRFGSSVATTKFLEALNYKVDSSITPFKTHYIDDKLPINNWCKPLEPYFETTTKKLLQVPLTLINPDFEKLPIWLQSKLASHDTMLKKILYKSGCRSKTRWLRPYREQGEGLIEIADYVVKNKFKKSDFAILNVMFHSNEILEKGSPYCKNREEVLSFVQSIDQLLNHIEKKYQLCSIGLSDVYALYYQG